jgi:hypothetical protein
MLVVTFTTFTAGGLDAAGGGGGGGGGGAIKKVTNCSFGNTSVNHSGSKSRKAMKKICKANESPVAQVLLLRCPMVESSRLSSNRGLSRVAEARGLIATGLKGSFAIVISCDLVVNWLFSTTDIVFLFTVLSSQRVSLRSSYQQSTVQMLFAVGNSSAISLRIAVIKRLCGAINQRV